MHLRCLPITSLQILSEPSSPPLITEKAKETEIHFSVLSVPSCSFNLQNMRTERTR